MKKNKMMRLASGLLVAVLITTSTISGTFAKYTTSDSATDTARVAKFGVTVEATNAEALFAETYNSNAVVSSETNVDVVAPGTTGTLAGFTITGTPEVKTEVVYSATLDLEKFGDYCPIIFTVEGTDYKAAGKTAGDIAALETAVVEAIADCTGTYAVGTPIADTLNVSWRWDFVQDAVNGVSFQTNDLDTVLGDAAAGIGGGEAAEITLAVTCTVNQVQ